MLPEEFLWIFVNSKRSESVKTREDVYTVLIWEEKIVSVNFFFSDAAILMNFTFLSIVYLVRVLILTRDQLSKV